MRPAGAVPVKNQALGLEILQASSLIIDAYSPDIIRRYCFYAAEGSSPAALPRVGARDDVPLCPIPVKSERSEYYRRWILPDTVAHSPDIGRTKCINAVQIAAL